MLSFPALRAAHREGLLDDVLPFWTTHAVDRQQGGFLTSLSRDGTVVDTDKGVWQQARFTWLLGELYNQLEARPQWLELAEHGARFLRQHCVDPADGRMWFHVTRDGRPIRKRRYAFTECFAAIAYGELGLATGEEAYAALARDTFERFLNHHADPAAGPPKFAATRPTRGLAIPMITIITAAELRQSIGLQTATPLIDQSVQQIVQFHLKEDIECVMETVGMDGQILDHFDGRTLNPGHAIECAWFIMWEGMLRNDRELIATGCRILDWMWARGWDERYGGILYYVDVYGHPVQEYWHDMKFWWPHCEAIIATLLAYHLTGDAKYAAWHDQVHRWAYDHFPDPEHGEWFGYLDRTGRITSTLKGNMWKGPFHLPRMQLVCGQIAERAMRDA